MSAENLWGTKYMYTIAIRWRVKNKYSCDHKNNMNYQLLKFLKNCCFPIQL